MKVLVPCPAKINTFLSVGPPGPSGYHPIRSVMQAVGLHDQLTVESSEATSIECNIELPKINTLTRTLDLLRDLVLVPPLKISLEKRIPIEAGLGGGSSDAAGLIRAISFLAGLPMDQHLFDVASAVGKDVPFFLMGGRARAEGLGDKLQPLEDEEPSWLIIAKPTEGVSSGPAYAALDQVPRPFADFPDDPWSGHNDFMQVAPTTCQGLVDQMKQLRASSAGLSGSGSAVWGRFARDYDAHEARDRCQEMGTYVFTCPTLTRQQSLLLERVD